MWPREFYIFCLFWANILATEIFIDSINDDYCLDYLDKCNVTRVKTKNETGITVITDKYKMELLNGRIQLTWGINQPVNLKSLRKLYVNNQYNTAEELKIESESTIRNASFVRSVHYMKALNIRQLKRYNDTISCCKIEEHDIDVSKGPSLVILTGHKRFGDYSKCFNGYFTFEMTNLREIQIHHSGIFHLDNNIFQNYSQLKSIWFSRLRLRNLNANTFENLTNIKRLKFLNCNLTDQEFLRSSALQSNLENLNLRVNMKPALDYLKNFQKLRKIYLNERFEEYYLQNVNTTNITALLCVHIQNEEEICRLNRGTNGKPCPRSCSCELHAKTNSFNIECSGRNALSNVLKELPIPITGLVSLYFENQGLTILPNTSLSEGFDRVRELHLANNNLTSLSTNQLPVNIHLLDIRNNSITSLNSRVVEYLQTRKTIFLQSGVKWLCDCKNQDMLTYLSTLNKKVEYLNTIIENTVRYQNLNGSWPVNECVCPSGEEPWLMNGTAIKFELNTPGLQLSVNLDIALYVAIFVGLIIIFCLLCCCLKCCKGYKSLCLCQMSFCRKLLFCRWWAGKPANIKLLEKETEPDNGVMNVSMETH